MSVFPESTYLFLYYMCQAGVLAEFLVRHLHRGMGERSLQYKKKKIIVDIGGLILVSVFVSTSTRKNH